MTRDTNRPLWGALLIVLAWASVATLGGLASAGENLTVWYASLDLPSWRPPNAVFGPVWTVLYALIAASTVLVYRARSSAMRTSLLGLFAVNAVLNLAWSWIFFGAHLIVLAAVEILVLLGSIVALIVRGRYVSPLAAWLLVPYLVWVAFASALNIAIAIMNPG